jgi:hypothetical protein
MVRGTGISISIYLSACIYIISVHPRLYLLFLTGIHRFTPYRSMIGAGSPDLGPRECYGAAHALAAAGHVGVREVRSNRLVMDSHLLRKLRAAHSQL